ncbi:ribosome-associated, YjgA [Tanacetum coccineum]
MSHLLRPLILSPSSSTWHLRRYLTTHPPLLTHPSFHHTHLRTLHVSKSRGLRPADAPAPEQTDSETEDERKSRNEKKREAKRGVKWAMDLALFNDLQIKRILSRDERAERVHVRAREESVGWPGRVASLGGEKWGLEGEESDRRRVATGNGTEERRRANFSTRGSASRDGTPHLGPRSSSGTHYILLLMFLDVVVDALRRVVGSVFGLRLVRYAWVVRRCGRGVAFTGFRYACSAGSSGITADIRYGSARAVSLDKEVFDAVMLVKRLGRDVREGKRRQFSYIGRLLRDVEPELIDGLIKATKDGDMQKFQEFLGSDKSDLAEVSEVEEESEDEDEELRKLVRNFCSLQDRNATPVESEGETKLDKKLLRAEKHLNRFLVSLAKQLPSEEDYIL